MKRPPTAEVNRRLTYDPEDGQLYWRPREADEFDTQKKHQRWDSRWTGTVAGGEAVDRGIWVIRLNGNSYPAHDLAWAITFNEWPVGRVTHVNGNRLDNRLVNLQILSYPGAQVPILAAYFEEFRENEADRRRMLPPDELEKDEFQRAMFATQMDRDHRRKVAKEALHVRKVRVKQARITKQAGSRIARRREADREMDIYGFEFVDMRNQAKLKGKDIPLPPSQEFVKELYYYDKEASTLRYRSRDPDTFKTERAYKQWSSRFQGKEIGKEFIAGLRIVLIGKHSYFVHHLLWLWHIGVYPDGWKRVNRGMVNNRCVEEVEMTKIRWERGKVRSWGDRRQPKVSLEEKEGERFPTYWISMPGWGDGGFATYDEAVIAAWFTN